MGSGVRSYLTAGITLVTASSIAVSLIAPQAQAAPEIRAASPAMQLAAQPFDSLDTPILDQVIANAELLHTAIAAGEPIDKAIERVVLRPGYNATAVGLRMLSPYVVLLLLFDADSRQYLIPQIREGIADALIPEVLRAARAGTAQTQDLPLSPVAPQTQADPSAQLVPRPLHAYAELFEPVTAASIPILEAVRANAELLGAAVAAGEPIDEAIEQFVLQPAHRVSDALAKSVGEPVATAAFLAIVTPLIAPALFGVGLTSISSSGSIEEALKLAVNVTVGLFAVAYLRPLVPIGSVVLGAADQGRLVYEDLSDAVAAQDWLEVTNVLAETPARLAYGALWGVSDPVEGPLSSVPRGLLWWVPNFGQMIADAIAPDATRVLRAGIAETQDLQLVSSTAQPTAVDPSDLQDWLEVAYVLTANPFFYVIARVVETAAPVAENTVTQPAVDFVHIIRAFGAVVLAAQTPIRLADAVLNGDGTPTGGGILSPEFSPLAALRTTREAIAAALVPDDPPVAVPLPAGADPVATVTVDIAQKMSTTMERKTTVPTVLAASTEQGAAMVRTVTEKETTAADANEKASEKIADARQMRESRKAEAGASAKDPRKSDRPKPFKNLRDRIRATVADARDAAKTASDRHNDPRTNRSNNTTSS